MGKALDVEPLLKHREILLQEAEEHLEQTDGSMDRVLSALETTQQIFEQVEAINQKLIGVSDEWCKDPGYRSRIEKLMILMEDLRTMLKKTEAQTLENKRRWDKGKEATEGYIHKEVETIFIDKNV